MGRHSLIHPKGEGRLGRVETETLRAKISDPFEIGYPFEGLAYFQLLCCGGCVC